MADAARYHRLQLFLSLLGLGLSIGYLVALIATGGSHGLARMAERLTSTRWGQVALVALALAAGHGALTLPLKLIRGYWLPRRFGLLHQSLLGWLGDQLKAALIGGALGLAAIEIVYALLALTPLWWLATAAVFIAAQIAMTAVLPIWIVPLFYTLTPLADAGLRERLLALARRTGVATIGVFVADQSRKSRTANAAVVGLGRTRRIILFDTLLTQVFSDEIESVLAHELGHHVHGDMRRGLLVNGALTLVTTGARRARARRGCRAPRPRRAGRPGRATVAGARGDRRSDWSSFRPRTVSRAGSSARPTTSRWPRPATWPPSSARWSGSAA